MVGPGCEERGCSGPCSPRGVEGLDFASPCALPCAGWAQRVPGANSLGVCAEALAKPFRALCRWCPPCPDPTRRRGCPRGDAAFPCLAGHGRGCLHTEPEAGDQRGLCRATLGLTRTASARRTGCREGRSRAAAAWPSRRGVMSSASLAPLV